MPYRGQCPCQGPHATLICCFTALIIVLLTQVHPSESILCGPCNPLLCEELVDCPKGITTDPCGCCEVCSKLVNETCGGKYGLLGRCARGLECFISPEIGQPITGHEEGVCKGELNFRVADQQVIGAKFDSRCQYSRLACIVLMFVAVDLCFAFQPVWVCYSSGELCAHVLYV